VFLLVLTAGYSDTDLSNSANLAYAISRYLGHLTYRFYAANTSTQEPCNWMQSP